MTTATTTKVSPIYGDLLRRSTARFDRWQKFRRVMTHTHTYSGKADHGGTVRPPHSYRLLADWAARMGIEAVGMGSPYTPASVQRYRHFDREAHELYHRPSFDKTSVRDDTEIARMLEEVNEIAGGRTLFYLDNETPKGRFGHLWWVGYQLDYPAWHDYDQPYDRWMCQQMAMGDDGDEPMPYERRPYREIVAMQRRAGALGFWAHPTSWWWGDDGRFITNIASEMPAHAIADGYLDGMVVMGYHAWRVEYMAIWFMLLDAGYRVSGVAEEDVGLSSESTWLRPAARTNHVYIEADELSVPALVNGFSSGRLTATNGPMLDMEVDGQPMGAAVPTSSNLEHHVTIWIDPMGSTGWVELIGQGGRMLWRQQVSGPMTVNVRLPGSGQRGYLLARYRGDEPGRDGPVAIGNPVYLHPRGQGYSRPGRTRLRLSIDAASRFCGGHVRFEQADGEPIGSGRLTAGVLEETLPASGRITLVAADGRAQTEYLINANPELGRLQRYLYRGRFLRDYPHLNPGELPPEAWRFEAYQQAMQQVTLNR